MISPPTRQRPLYDARRSAETVVEADPPAYSVSSGSSGHGSSSEGSPYSPPLASPDAIVPAFPLLDALADPLSPNSRHLPHLVASALSLTLTKPSVQVVLSSSMVFLSPPKKDEFGLSDTDYGIEGDQSGKDARVCGFVNVVAPSTKPVKGIQLRLVGTHRLIFPRDGPRPSAPVDEDFLVKELIVNGDGKGLTLEKGVNTWEFCFSLPSTCPAADESDSGWTRYRIHATVLGSGSLLKSDLAVTKKVIVTCAPPREDSVHQFQVHVENCHPQLGPLAFDLSSNQFILASPLVISLTLAAPPPQLAIFAIQAYTLLTTHMSSLKGPSKTATRTSGKNWIVRDGQLSGWTAKGFSTEARAKGALMDGSRIGGDDGGLKEGEVWKWSKAGRLPGEEQRVAPTTHPGTDTALRYTNELFVEAIFNEVGYGTDDETVKIAPLFQRQVMIASCCCMLLQLRLPNYSADAPLQTPVPSKLPEGCIECMCQMKWEKLKADELALMRNGYDADTLGASGSDTIEERRRGGLCHRVEEFGGVVDRQAELKAHRGEEDVGGVGEEEGGGALGLTMRMAEAKLGETF